MTTKTAPLFLTLMLLAPAVASQADEALTLDKDFAFRLTQAEPVPTPTPAAGPNHPPVVLQKRSPGTPLKTPDGEPLPPGSRPFKFDGRTYYFIPL